MSEEEQQLHQDAVEQSGFSDPRLGQVFFTWKFEEFKKGHRGKTWYTIAGLLGALLLIYAVVTENFTFAVLLVLMAFVYFMLEWSAPGPVRCTIGDTGIIIGGKFYRYTDIESFWILFQPPIVKNLYFRFKGSKSPKFSIPLEDIDPVALRQILLAFLTEDLEQEDMPISESWGKIFKL
jgi:hypothetical protein